MELVYTDGYIVYSGACPDCVASSALVRVGTTLIERLWSSPGGRRRRRRSHLAHLVSLTIYIEVEGRMMA